jgi:hypothetical protein
MYYIYESIFVGIYVLIIFFVVNYIINKIINKSTNLVTKKNKIYFILFITGFLKHLFGYILNIHTYYCNYGFACKNNNKNDKNFISVKTNYLFLESIIEGIIFVPFYIILKNIFYNKY